MMAVLLPAWNFLKSLPWKWIGLALAALFIVREIERYGYHERDGEVDNLNKTINDMKDASAKAAAQNKSEVHTQEAAQTNHTKDQNHDDQIRKSAADDAVSRYISLHTIKAGSASSVSNVSSRTDASGSGNQESSSPELHDAVAVSAQDVELCRDWVLKAQSWDNWYPGAAKIINDAADKAK